MKFTLVQLSCVDDDAQGQPLGVLWQRKLDGQVITGEAWDFIANCGFDPPGRFAAYLNTLRWNCVTSTDPNRLQSPFRAGIRLARTCSSRSSRRYAPAIHASGGGTNLMPALACDSKFWIRTMFRVYAGSAASVSTSGPRTPRFLISQRLLIDEAYAGPLRDWLGTFHPVGLLILNEAHHAALEKAPGRNAWLRSSPCPQYRDEGMAATLKLGWQLGGLFAVPSL